MSRHVNLAAIRAEENALDKIHEVLNRPEYRENGITAEELSVQTELAIGRIREVLRASKCVIKRQPGSMRWIADWGDHDGFSMDKPSPRPSDKDIQKALRKMQNTKKVVKAAPQLKAA